MIKQLLTVSVSVFFIQSLPAHELPLSGIFPNKSVSSAYSYSLTGNQIEQEYNLNSQYYDFSKWLNDKSGNSLELFNIQCYSANQTKTCGQVDHFYRAAVVATSMCNAYALSFKNSYPQGLAPKFTAPESFIDGLNAAENHHQNYDMSHGISFDCVYPIVKTSYYKEK